MHYSKIFVFTFTTACLAGCVAVGPDFQTPKAPLTSRYTEKALPPKTSDTKNVTAGNAQQFQAGHNIPAQWWTLFRSPALNALIVQGLNNNPSLESAQAAIRRAQENLNEAVGTALFPSVDASLAANRQRASNSALGAEGNTIFNLYNASVNVSYNLDFFGGAHRYREGLLAQINYQQFEREGTLLTLSANIVTTAVSEASTRAQISATAELIRSQETQLTVVQKQFNLGGVSQADVLKQQTQLAQTRATLPPLQKQLGKLRNSLAVLTGSLPSEAHLPVLRLEDLTLPTQLPISLPSRLVQQRPDVRASEALLHYYSAQVGVAIANRLPKITLTGSYGYSSNQSHELLTPDSILWNLGGQLLQPVFKGGALKAKQNAAIADYDKAVADYKTQVLKAFQEVADALHAIQTDAQALKTQVQAERAASATYLLTQKQYKLGAISYLERLDAERQYQQTRISRIQAQAARYADTAALFQALGGGWWNSSQ
jgi:NodT family efflux transporter outer membrane factor (OMF) lipoprotein